MEKRSREGAKNGSGGQEISAPRKTSTSSRKTLVAQAIAGDREALSDLLTWVRERALRQAMAKTQDPDEAEDIAQEVLIRVFRSLHTFRFQSRFSSWVFRIIENQIQSRFRSKASAQRAEREALLLEGNLHPSCHTEITVDADRLWDTVKTAADGLPELQDRVFRLVAIKAWEPCDAARALGKSQTNVRATLSRARVKIRERLLDQAPALVRDLGYLEPHRAA